MMKLAILSTTVAAAAAFSPVGTQPVRTALHSTVEDTAVEVEAPVDTAEIPADIPQPAPAVAAINGWVPNETANCYGLPGAVAPTGYFDPLGFAQSGISLNEVKRNREAEVMHGRVAMLACLGYVAGEQLPSPFGIVGPANDQLQQMPAPAFALLTVAIAAAELKRATIGWVEPDGSFQNLWRLRDNYYPGDLGFDPLGLKPKEAKAFADMQTRELQNGRLAMIGWAGMCAQEIFNHRTIFETIDFYQKVSAGINPYEGCGDGVIC